MGIVVYRPPVLIPSPFLIGFVEEAVKMKEETEEDQNLKVTPRPRGRPRKTRKAPGNKLTTSTNV